jgi:membrane fusion protein, copper/silver efflux system
MDNSFQKNIFGFFLFFVFGVFLGWFLSHISGNVDNKEAFLEQASTIWTCPLHPEIRKTEPGNCPICNSALVVLDQKENDENLDKVLFPNNSKDLDKLSTTIITKQSPMKDLYIYGKVQANGLAAQEQRAVIPGRLDKMVINSTGERVSKGQVLAQIYSPEFVSAQQDFLEAASNKKSDPIKYNSAKSRLQKFSLSEAQILDIERKERVQINTDVVSNVAGVVIARLVNDGEYVKKGSVICVIADLSKVWIIFDVEEGNLPFINKGDQVSFSCKSLPETTFKGNIQFVDPKIDPNTHLSKVRVEFDNSTGLLKPEMQATGIVHANLSRYSDELVVPQSSVLWSGRQPYVYVKQVEGNKTVFNVRYVTLGTKIGDNYVVSTGLCEGEEIILQGASSLKK